MGAGHAPGRTMGVMHVMRAHGRHAAAAAAHKLRRRDLVKVVVRHITGGSLPQEAGNDARRVFGSLTGLCRGVLKYTRGHQVREGVRGCDAHDATTTKVMKVIVVSLFIRKFVSGRYSECGNEVPSR